MSDLFEPKGEREREFHERLEEAWRGDEEDFYEVYFEEIGVRDDSALIEHDNLDNLLTQSGEIPDMRWFIVRSEGCRHIMFDCQHLDADGRCEVYGDRPDMCRNFECDLLKGEASIDEWREKWLRDDNPDYEVLKEVTDRVNEIIDEHT